MRWLLDNIDGLKDNPNLCFTTVDAYLIAKLTNCKSILTDSSNAGRTMLMDINTLEWSDKMLGEYGIQKKWLPELKKKSSDDFGKVLHESLPMLEGVPITGVLGDQHAACLGHVLREGQVKNTYGTGCFLLQNTGS
jgi:glycerol kinase